MSEPGNNGEASPPGGEGDTAELQPYTEWGDQQPQPAAPPMQEAVCVQEEPAPEPLPPIQQQLVDQAVETMQEESAADEIVEASVPMDDVATPPPQPKIPKVKEAEEDSNPPVEKPVKVTPPPAPAPVVTTNGTDAGVTGYKKSLRKRSEVVIKHDIDTEEDSDTVELHFSDFKPKKRKGKRRGRKKTNLRSDPKKTERLIMETQGKVNAAKKTVQKPTYNSPRYSYRGMRGHYNNYTQIERLEIGRQALMNGHMATAKKFGVHESTVRDFRMKLEKHVASGRLSLTVPFEEQELPALGKRGRPSKPKLPKPPRPRDEQGKIRRGHYKVYTQKERLDIGRHAIIHGSGATIKKYAIHESTVRDFRKKLEAYVEAGVVSLTVPLEEQVLPPIGRRGRKRDPTKIRPPKTDGKRRRRRKKKEIAQETTNPELSMADMALRQMQNTNWPPQWPAQFPATSNLPPGHHMPPTSHTMESHHMLTQHNQLPTQLPIPGQLPPHLAQSHQMIPPVVSSPPPQMPPASHHNTSGPLLEFLGLPPQAQPQHQQQQHHHLPSQQHHPHSHPTPPPRPQPTPSPHPSLPPPPQSPHPSISSIQPASPGPSSGRNSIPPPPIASPPPHSISPELTIDRSFVAETLQTENLGSLMNLQNRSRRSLDKAILTILQAKRKRNKAKTLKMVQPETNKRKREMDQCKVSLGTQDTHKRWMMLKEDLGFDTHEELAMHLMDLHAALCMPACNKFGEEIDKHYPPIEPKPKEPKLTPEQIHQKQKQKDRQAKILKQRQLLRQQFLEQEKLQKKIKDKIGVPDQEQVVNNQEKETKVLKIQEKQQQYEVPTEQLQQQQEQLHQQQQEQLRQEQLRQQEQLHQQEQERLQQAQLHQQEQLHQHKQLQQEHLQQEQLQQEQLQQEQLQQREHLQQHEQLQQEQLQQREQLRQQEQLQQEQLQREQLQHQEQLQQRELQQEQLRQHQQVVQMVIPDHAPIGQAPSSPYPTQPHIITSSRDDEQTHSLQQLQVAQETHEPQHQLHIQSTSAPQLVYTSTHQPPLIVSRIDTQSHITMSTTPYTSTVQMQQPPLMATRQSPLIQVPRGQDQQQPLPLQIIHAPVLVARQQQEALMSPLSPRPEQPPYTSEDATQPHIATIARHPLPPFPGVGVVAHVPTIPLERQEPQPQYVLSASPHPQEPVRYVAATQEQQQQQQYPVTSQDQQRYGNNV